LQRLTFQESGKEISKKPGSCHAPQGILYDFTMIHHFSCNFYSIFIKALVLFKKKRNNEKILLFKNYTF